LEVETEEAVVATIETAAAVIAKMVMAVTVMTAAEGIAMIEAVAAVAAQIAVVTEMVVVVRGHQSFSLLPLSSPTLHLFICILPPHLCTILKDYIHSRLTNSRRLPASSPACTSTASDGLRTH
jgi:hypothetical protein